ncbi:EAL domain-containing protein [Neobacillus sp. PS3-40]|jgi:diguanylate cyclase (GGDEF)-like protein|uniref:putative bifunctional diguanylate cyclase/phosphodiesterase n=1 Tax=Neobacillus sp. PS3-40 TaxID=3070679 RepID=UPI0027DF9B34|nr:EAL domain-containing protein [Neobacillus sp. PS3-40]WML44907.1 EAL domain-containing protein [Neobacillus sp. PS3-40]
MKVYLKNVHFIYLIYLIPLILDDGDHTQEIIWLVYIFPSIVLPFKYGKKGGLIAALIATLIHGLNEYVEIVINHEIYSAYNIWCMVIISIVNFTVAITIGFLVEKIKYKQHSLQRVVSKMEFMAFHDHLTGLPNRWNLEIKLKEAIEAARKDNSYLAVLVLDLDRFKLINESLGHSNGDQLLKDVAKRFSSTIRGDDFIARQGGDEFILFLPNLHSKEEANRKIENILQIVGRPFYINNHEYFITCSVGVSYFPNDGETWQELIQHADIAMYSAKDLGRNGYQPYTIEKLQEINDVVKIESHLRRALLQNEFTLQYQPLIDLQSGKIFGMEALIRWNSTELGAVTPAEFIPIAEEIGIIGSLGTWVLKEACTQTKILSELNQTPIRVAVNISSKQFKDKKFVDIVCNTLKETGLNPAQLELEITESVSLDNIDELILKLKLLKEMGISIAIDDFGTGYSSISYLKHLPVDTLKIDQSFIRNMLCNFKDRALVESIISLSKSFGFNVTAEGVESCDQLELLKSFNCGQAQGYLFSKPVEIHDFYRVFKNLNEGSPNLLLPVTIG